MSITEAEQRLLDLRPIPRPHRHAIVLALFSQLAPGEAFELVNDHDPLGLLYQFNQTLPGAFTWDYLESGPKAWHVRLGRP